MQSKFTKTNRGRGPGALVLDLPFEIRFYGYLQGIRDSHICCQASIWLWTCHLIHLLRLSRSGIKHPTTRMRGDCAKAATTKFEWIGDWDDYAFSQCYYYGHILRTQEPLDVPGIKLFTIAILVDHNFLANIFTINKRVDCLVIIETWVMKFHRTVLVYTHFVWSMVRYRK